MSTNPGCNSSVTVMNTGASVSPSLFVHAGATAITRRAVRIRALFFMGSSSSSTENPGGDEDEQLVVLLGARLVAEQVSEDRDLPQTRDHVVLILVVDLEDAADDGRAAVANEDLP